MRSVRGACSVPVTGYEGAGVLAAGSVSRDRRTTPSSTASQSGATLPEHHHQHPNIPLASLTPRERARQERIRSGMILDSAPCCCSCRVAGFGVNLCEFEFIYFPAKNLPNLNNGNNNSSTSTSHSKSDNDGRRLLLTCERSKALEAAYKLQDEAPDHPHPPHPQQTVCLETSMGHPAAIGQRYRLCAE